ncbi:hypothetical protein L9F63_021672, partial [Diploptera punctata]
FFFTSFQSPAFPTHFCHRWPKQMHNHILDRDASSLLSLPLVLELVSLLSFDKMRRQLTLEQRIYVYRQSTILSNSVIFYK